MKSVLSVLTDFSLNQSAPVVPEVSCVVEYDSDGNKKLAYRPVDYSKHIASLGVASDWLLASLMAAGVNPSVNIHTSVNTAVEGYEQFASSVPDFIKAVKSEIISESTETIVNE